MMLVDTSLMQNSSVETPCQHQMAVPGRARRLLQSAWPHKSRRCQWTLRIRGLQCIYFDFCQRSTVLPYATCCHHFWNVAFHWRCHFHSTVSKIAGSPANFRGSAAVESSLPLSPRCFGPPPTGSSLLEESFAPKWCSKCCVSRWIRIFCWCRCWIYVDSDLDIFRQSIMNLYEFRLSSNLELEI